MDERPSGGGQNFRSAGKCLYSKLMPEMIAANPQLEHRTPGISCLCLTYGRIFDLEEALESFLRQDYAGPKELIILNDLDVQTLTFEHPEVRIINLDRRFDTFGEKRQTICDLARYDILCHWDDDDIYLRHRLTLSARKLADGWSFFKPTTAFYWNSGSITSLERNLFHIQSCFHRRLFQECGTYPFQNTAEDLAFEQKLHGRSDIRIEDIDPAENFYIYRWEGVGHHLSSLGDDRRDGLDAYEYFDAVIRRSLADGNIPHGKVRLRPHWKFDYQGQVREYLQSSS